MENIGKRLKERRLEMGLSIDDISKRTRLTAKHIGALEEGDISFFHDDLAYLRFFVKSYCDAVNIDFDEVKDEVRESVNEYTQSFATNMELTHQEIERNIAKSDKLTKVQTADVKVKKRRKFNKPDMSLVSLIAIVGIVAIVIIFAFVVFLKSGAGKEDKGNTNRPTAPEQKETGNNQYPETDDPKKEEEEKELAVTKGDVKNDVTNYTLENAKDGEELTFVTAFNGSNSGFSISVDGKTVESKVYKIGEKATTKVKVKKGMRISLYVGCTVKTSITVNGKNVPMDEASNPDVYPGSCIQNRLEFTVGDTNESTK